MIHRLKILTHLVALIAFATGLHAGTESKAPSFPRDGHIPFTAQYIEETLENQKIERVELSGPRRIVCDPIPGLRFRQGPQEKAFVSAHPHYRDTHASLYAFPREQFAPKITPQILNEYLGRKQQEAPAESQLQVIEEATQDTGPAKFRFLGGKAYTLTYDYDKIDSLERKQRFRCTENWRLSKGIFYVFVVEAPVKGFARHYKLVSRSAANMHFAE